MDATQIYQAVQERYSSASKTTSDDTYATSVASAFGYSQTDLDSIPQDANLGLSCGNPLAIAGLKEGETVIDLGCGAGFDIFLAAKKVRATGRAIGVDMNDDMLAKALRNKELSQAGNTEFVKARITDISPLPAKSADCIISNCVVNLVPEQEKQLVFNEMARLLKTGGRLAMSDILLKKDLTPQLKEDMALYVGCIAGASKVDDYERYLRHAGFQEIIIVDAENDLNVYKHSSSSDPACCANASLAPGTQTEDTIVASRPASTADQHQNVDYNEFAASFKIFAVLAA